VKKSFFILDGSIKDFYLPTVYNKASAVFLLSKKLSLKTSFLFLFSTKLKEKIRKEQEKGN